MKILFIARHFAYFRNYDLALRELAMRGHQIHLAVERDEKIGGRAAIEALARECPGITLGRVPERRVDTWSGAVRRLRLGLDYIRFLDPFYDTAPIRRTRARDRAPRLVIAVANPPFVGGPRWRAMIRRLLHVIDTMVPPPPSIVDYIRQRDPDALLVTPLVDLGSQQIDYVRAAKQLGVPSALPVWSWDNLTTKAHLRDHPERVIVWNDTQRTEAIRTHGVPADRIVVTGAQCFDHWFGRGPSRTKDAFCSMLGLPPDRPLILWAGSGLVKGIPPEPQLVREWLGWLRRSGDPILEQASVLIRPHPAHSAEWDGLDWREYGNVAMWGGSNPVDETSRTDYFDSLYHSNAVIGLNTSALIEGAILGREVMTILVPRFHDAQEGSEHFRYLLQIGGGLLRVARDSATHLSQLGAALRRPPSNDHPYRAFLEMFVRPQGLDRPATPAFVAAVEELRDCRVEAERPMRVPVWRRALFGGVARLASRMTSDSMVRSPRELDPDRLARIADASSPEQVDKA